VLERFARFSLIDALLARKVGFRTAPPSPSSHFPSPSLIFVAAASFFLRVNVPRNCLLVPFDFPAPSNVQKSARPLFPSSFSSRIRRIFDCDGYKEFQRRFRLPRPASPFMLVRTPLCRTPLTLRPNSLEDRAFSLSLSVPIPETFSPPFILLCRKFHARTGSTTTFFVFFPLLLRVWPPEDFRGRAIINSRLGALSWRFFAPAMVRARPSWLWISYYTGPPS